jgi:hypothetical protein
MEKYTDYAILHAAAAGDVSKQVMQYLKDGWLLLGAPFSYAGEEGPEICQAMIKQDTAKPGSIGFNR